jgi:hypothetical protein
VTDSPLIPGSHSRPIAPDGKWAAEWYRYLRDLTSYVRATQGNSEELAALEQRIAALEAAGANPFEIIGRLSVLAQGSPQDGEVVLQLVGDERAPLPTHYYGTNAVEVKGFHPVSDTVEVDSGELTKDVSAEGVTTFGLADVADSGTGELLAITRDGFGRVTGTRPGEFIDLADTPSSYTGAAEKAVGVNAAGDGLVFFDLTVDYAGSTYSANTLVYPHAVAFEDRLLVGSKGNEQDAIRINGVTTQARIKASSFGGTATLLCHQHSTTNYPLLILSRSNSNSASHAAVTNGMTLGSILPVGWASGTPGYIPVGSIDFEVDATGTVSATSMPGRLSFKVTPDGGVTPIEFMSADNSGVVEFTNNPNVAGTDLALLTQTITNGDTTHAPSGDAVFGALAGKADTSSLGTAAFEDTGTGTGTIPIFDGSTPAWGNPAIVMEAAASAGRVGVTGIAGETDAEAQAVFVFNAIGSASVSGSAEKRLGIFFFNTSGATAGNRGGLFGINLKQNGSTTLSTRLAIQPDGPVRPGSDNVQSLGAASFRWSVVYAGTGTINTSDAREKMIRGPLTVAELAAASELASAGVIYQWNDAVELKGDAARWHFGPTVQAVISVMEKHNLDPFRYAFICYDEWDELPEILDEDGGITQEYRQAGNRYSLRPDQLLMFIARGQEERLRKLEALLT